MEEKRSHLPLPPPRQLRTGIAPDCSRPPAPPLPHRIPPLPFSPPRAAPQPPPPPASSPSPRQDTGQSRTGGSLAWWGRGMGLLPPHSPRAPGGRAEASAEQPRDVGD
ncbi:hypothetical protein KIL84_008822, partial [Mauremys mutica]